jgi:hypothetical protein
VPVSLGTLANLQTELAEGPKREVPGEARARVRPRASPRDRDIFPVTRRGPDQLA